MPRVRFTIRRTMVFVAVIAILLGLGITWLKWLDSLKLAGYHREEAKHWLAVHAQLEYDDQIQSVMSKPRFVAPSRYKFVLERFAYHARLRHTYERAARFPWLSVPPEPPEPK